MPVAPHRRRRGRRSRRHERAENRAAVHRAWRLHADHIRHSLVNGFYQGWDLHPAQLADPLRRGLRVLPRRPRRGVRAADATSSRRPRRRRWSATSSTTPRPGRACSTTSCAAINCGAITEEEALGDGLTLEELRGRSFVKILEGETRFVQVLGPWSRSVLSLSRWSSRAEQIGRRRRTRPDGPSTRTKPRDDLTRPADTSPRSRPYGSIGRHEDLVAVLQAERRRDPPAGDGGWASRGGSLRRLSVEHRFAHGVERVLHRAGCRAPRKVSRSAVRTAQRQKIPKATPDA